MHTRTHAQVCELCFALLLTLFASACASCRASSRSRSLSLSSLRVLQPTNDLDVDTLRALEDALQEFDGAGIIVSHDRWFLDRVCTHILAFEDSGVKHCEGNFSEYEEMRKITERADSKGKKKKFKNISIDT